MAVPRSLGCYLADTTSSATVEFGLLAAGVALAIALALGHIGDEGRVAARGLLRFRNQ